VSTPGEHRGLREQLGWYALGHGTPEERAGVRAHLDGCAACRAELAELTPLTRWLDRVDPDRLDDQPAPPPGLGDAVLARIAAERPRRASPRRALAAAAVVGVAAAGFGIGWLARPVPDPLPLEPVAVQAGPGIEATADVVPHTWGLEVRLTGEGFTAGAVYRVVVTDEEGAAVPAGQFLGVGPAELRCNLNSSVLREDAAGFQVVAADGTVVASSEL
jgi:anti-sigma factor RsiW